jgi:hypothetical protein
MGHMAWETELHVKDKKGSEEDKDTECSKVGWMNMTAAFEGLFLYTPQTHGNKAELRDDSESCTGSSLR